MAWPEYVARMKTIEREVQMELKRTGARAPILVEVVVKCPTTHIEAVIMRPGYNTPQKGEVKCPHCAESHPYALDFDPVLVYKDDAPKEKR
jgi:hypothetical protein